ncbi:MAG: hypothetical protein HQM15_07670 [Deltaproteobacteria bacterium]|nr:hypothetical protein [Deltaproteobacteria bacterium]
MKDLKIKSVEADNKKKLIHLTYSSDKKISITYESLGIRIPIERIWVDAETRGKSVGFLLNNGETNYMPYDQALAIVKDPEYMIQNQMEIIVAKIKLLLEKKISGKKIDLKNNLSKTKIHTLLKSLAKKNLVQLYQIASSLGLEIEIALKKAA